MSLDHRPMLLSHQLFSETVPLSYPSHFMIFNYTNTSLKRKCCVLNEEIQGKLGENLWKIRQTTNEDFSLQEVFRDGAVILFFFSWKTI
jgi:hypothetical protein